MSNIIAVCERLNQLRHQTASRAMQSPKQFSGEPPDPTFVSINPLESSVGVIAPQIPPPLSSLLCPLSAIYGDYPLFTLNI